MSVSKIQDESRRVLSNWYFEKKHTDVLLVLIDVKNHRVEIRCHKVVMATRSPILESLLYRGWNGNKLCLDDKLEDFMAFLEYLYTNIMEPQKLAAIVKCAFKYKVSLNFEDFDAALTGGNMIPLYILLRSLAGEVDAGIFMKILERKIKFQAYQVLTPVSNEFRTMSRENLLQILGFENMNISLKYLIQAINEWAECQCINQGLELNSANKCGVLGVRLDHLPSVKSVVCRMAAIEFHRYLTNGDFHDFVTHQDLLQLTLDLTDTEYIDQMSKFFERDASLSQPVQQQPRIYVSINFTNIYSKFTVELMPSSTVADLKEMILEIAGVPANDQMLQYGGRPLRDDFTMERYNIPNGGSINLYRDCSDRTQPSQSIQVKME